MIKTIQRIWLRLRKNIEKHPFSMTEVRDLLKETFPSATYMELTDRVYATCEWDMMKSLMSVMPIKFTEYRPDIHDCDNFARELWGITAKMFPLLPIGYCHVVTEYGQKHAANFCIYRRPSGKPGFAFVEPQTGKMFMANWKPYLLIV